MCAQQTSITPGMQVKVVNSYDADSLCVAVSLFSSVDWNTTELLINKTERSILHGYLNIYAGSKIILHW